jgi:hypothetical protein
MRRVLALSACLALAACSSSSGHQQGAAAQPTSAAPVGASSSPTSQASTGPSGSPAAPQPSSHVSSGPLSPSPGASSSEAPGQPAPTRATAAGAYTYDTSGQVKFGATPQDASGTTTLTISALQNGHQRSTLHPNQGQEGDTIEDLVVRTSGTYLADLNITTFSKEFRPSPPVLLFPDPAKVGSTWSWSATSTDGKSHATASNKVERTETLTIGGQRVSTVVLQTHLVITGDVAYTADVTTWVSPTYRLPVKDHTLAHGTLVVPFTADITDVMRSVHPA